MQKIGNSTTTANAKNEFTEGSPGAGVDATLITASWLNAIQRELVGIVEGSGITIDPRDDAQLLKAIQALQAWASKWANIADKPTTLGGYSIAMASQGDAEAQSDQDNTKPMGALRVYQAIVKKLGLATQASTTDATAGKLMQVGAGGLMGFVESFQDANTIPYRTGFFGAAGALIANGPPSTTSGDMVVQIVFNVNAAVQHWHCYSTDRKFFRRKQVDKWSAWKEDLHTGNLATDGEVDEGTDEVSPITSKRLATRLGKLLVQATESAFGWLKIATQTQVNTGADDTTAVTPKKLRMGVVLSLTANGYLILPVWLGSLIIQWTTSSAVAPGGTGSVSWPIAFPTMCIWASGSPLGNGGNANAGNVVAGTPTVTSVPIYNWGVINSPARVFSFGV